ncbi:FAD/NAD-P-binding domain-containing protein [Roridomyces roridus]|uniref:FAD/NAD-P-binding domain-containing protein n=1 Tax=Roridomyces roridus TaxID=1738132 RepID=A0AAD7BIG9_9AGAR|nr:FAD/NAD-P-binding domain-containing protein [Roridomyces roridus]
MSTILSRLSIFGRKTTQSKDDGPKSATASAYTAPEFSIDAYRPIKVICIGAGFSGILAAIRFQQKVPNLELNIYEKEDAIGGTWRANRYPGAACDVPSHCYQFSFEDQSQWSGMFSTGPEILANMERVVDKYKIRKYITLKHELTHAKYDEGTGKWTVRIRRGEDGKEFEEECDVFMLCIGSLNRWHWPEIDGLKDFKGKLVHSAQWDVGEGTWEEGVKDWGDKTVGVIGNGSSGIQIVAAIHPKIKKLVNYSRAKTWICPAFGAGATMDNLGRDSSNTDPRFTAEELEMLKDPKRFAEFRHITEHEMNKLHPMSIRDSEVQKAVRKLFEDHMKQVLAPKPGLYEKIVPEWSVFCRRLTPCAGYLEALAAENTTYETTPIKRITAKGVELTDGRHDDLDVLVCATGFDVSYHYPFEIVGRGGTTLNERWAAGAEAYLSIAVDSFPNMFLMYGPGSGLNAAGIIVMIEAQMGYIVKAVQKLQSERLKSIEVKKAATADWSEHMQAYFPKTVYLDSCHSWYKTPEGRIIGLYPGSALHSLKALANPRWEDYDYERIDKTHNRLYWLGDGQTENERTQTGDLAWYLNNVDVPPIPAQ